MKIIFQRRQILATLAFVLFTASAASAAVAAGTVPFNFTGVSDDTPGALVPNTQFTVASVAASSDGTGSFDTCPASPDCVAASSAASFSPGTFTGDALIGLLLSFGPSGRYTYQVSSQNAPNISHPGTGETFYNIVTNGTFADSAATFSSATASLIITFDETCSTGCSISGAASFATPPAETTTPEPITLTLAGGALIGLALLFRRTVKV